SGHFYFGETGHFYLGLTTIFISYKSLSYAGVESPIGDDWAFLLILYVSWLLFNQCFTVLLNEV
ncbi:hypothetical protein, partial [Acinetobacter pragensis]|uniref:hypothetical protein n=1 Tax=Acinetobacter pragensis TaxID=1806892 RepID=UPI0033411B70